MSFVVAAVTTMAVASVYNAYESNQARKDAKAAAERSNQLQEQAMAEERARRNQKSLRAADKGAFYDPAVAAGGGSGPSSGLSGTLLTGSQGALIDPANVGKKTLLG